MSISETQFALIVGGSTGGGVLTYQGKKYPFKIGGMSLGANVGVSKLSASGEVYDLTDISKFPGTFTKLESSITLGEWPWVEILTSHAGARAKTIDLWLTSNVRGLVLAGSGMGSSKSRARRACSGSPSA